MVPLAEIRQDSLDRLRHSGIGDAAALALEAVVHVAERRLVELEEITEVILGKMALHVLFLVNNALAERFLVSLALQNLLFDCPRKTCMSFKRNS